MNDSQAIIVADRISDSGHSLNEAWLRARVRGKILDNGTRINLEVKEGDHVLFGKYSGTDIKVEGEEYLIIREDEVLGILAESAKSKASK